MADDAAEEAAAAAAATLIACLRLSASFISLVIPPKGEGVWDSLEAAGGGVVVVVVEAVGLGCSAALRKVGLDLGRGSAGLRKGSLLREVKAEPGVEKLGGGALCCGAEGTEGGAVSIPCFSLLKESSDFDELLTKLGAEDAAFESDAVGFPAASVCGAAGLGLGAVPARSFGELGCVLASVGGTEGPGPSLWAVEGAGTAVTVVGRRRQVLGVT